MTAFETTISRWWVGSVAVLCLCGAVGRADDANVKPNASLQTKAAENKIKFLGLIDLRPSWTSQSGGVGTENTIGAGFKFTPDFQITYEQYFNSNLYSPHGDADSSGLQAKLNIGALRTQVKNIWKNEANGLALNYENRLMVPVDEASQKKGLIAANRNYLKLSKKISDTVKITASEVLIPIVNSKAGVVSANGSSKANAIFENRVYLITEVKLTEKLSLTVPLMFHQTRYANFRPEAAKNSSWDFYVWTWPEIGYALTDNYSVGLAYYNNISLFKSDLSGTNFGAALESGVFQLAFTATL